MDPLCLANQVILKLTGKEQLLKPFSYSIPGRNNVYLSEQDNLIVKIYGERRRWAREIASLRLLKEKKPPIKTPTLIEFSDSTNEHWVVMEKIDGQLLSEVNISISDSQYRQLLYQAGVALAQIHTATSFDGYGDWNEKQQELQKHSSYKEFIVSMNRRRAERTLDANYEENDLFERAYEKMLSLEYTLDGVIDFSLCHNDYSFRKLLLTKECADWSIYGLIDYEMSFPSDPEFDLTQMMLKNYFELGNSSFIDGYRSQRELSKSFSLKYHYYLISLCLEICSWALEKAPYFYCQAVKVLRATF